MMTSVFSRFSRMPLLDNRTVGLGLILLGAGFSSCSKPEVPVVYKSDAFTLYRNGLEQGKLSAKVVSPSEIHSGYFNHPRDIQFKLALNGGDFEQGYGIDHKALLFAENGRAIVPTITFGTQLQAQEMKAGVGEFLEPNTEAVFTVDMRPVLEQISKRGFYEAWNGAKIESIEHLAIVGNRPPMDWDFGTAHTKPGRALTDPDGDGVYQGSLIFNKTDVAPDGKRVWKLQTDVSAYPRYTSGVPILDAVYNLSLEELIKNKTPDGYFDTGAMWQGVWTRDVAYSILLSLAFLDTEIAKNCLRKKVSNGKIVQDTGTGGSWPVSSDRMIWVAAAYEIYLVTGDVSWLDEILPIIQSSVDADRKAVYSPDGFVRGETTFTDWRSQSYPGWMEPKDIYASNGADNTAIHIYALRVLSKLLQAKGRDGSVYEIEASRLETAFQKTFWDEDAGYYLAYRYGNPFPVTAPQMVAMTQVLPSLFDIATSEQKRRLAESVPLTPFGIPTFYPHFTNIPAYHNNSVWPFVQALWTWAMARNSELSHVNVGLSALYRGTLLFLTNKENLRADNGNDYKTEINSDRQLWSVAGQLASVYRVLFGMQFEENGLRFRPVVPAGYQGTHHLERFRYRNAVLSVKISGHGTSVKEVLLNGQPVKEAFIPAETTGDLALEIKLEAGNRGAAPSIMSHTEMLQTPEITLQKNTLQWKPVEGAVSYTVFCNGVVFGETNNAFFELPKPEKLQIWQVRANSTGQPPSMLSNPVETFLDKEMVWMEPDYGKAVIKATGFTNDGYAEITRTENTKLRFKFGYIRPGTYRLDVRYANGSGPVDTDNKCAVRTLLIDGKPSGPVVMPQRGKDAWSNWGWSNSMIFTFKGGERFHLEYESWNENMNGETNTALIDGLRLVRIK
jgi:hypothetical protein